MLALLTAVPASAQAVDDATAATGARAAENAVRSAGDAFGTSIGRETIGLYNAGNVRGFSPRRRAMCGSMACISIRSGG
jgi:iron complex outermembrane receptor protein